MGDDPNEEKRESFFPHVTAYLAGLPDGLNSYPDCRSKGSLLRSALEDHDADRLLPGLPDVLKQRVLHPPPAGIWIPAAHLIAVNHAIFDVYYPTDNDILEWGRRRTSRLAAQAIYQALIRVSGPRVFFTMTTKINRLFQKGTTSRRWSTTT